MSSFWSKLGFDSSGNFLGFLDFMEDTDLNKKEAKLQEDEEESEERDCFDTDKKEEY